MERWRYALGSRFYVDFTGLPPKQGLCQHRITLVVAFWGAKIKPQQGAPGNGPMRQLASAAQMESSFQQTWLDDFALHAQIRAQIDRYPIHVSGCAQAGIF